MSPEEAQEAENRVRTILLAGNKNYAATKHQVPPTWSSMPQRSAIGIVCCMDPRSVPEIFFDIGHRPSFATIRNAGGRAKDAMRSLRALMSVGGGGQVGLGAVVVVHHTDCGLQHFDRAHHVAGLRRGAPANVTDAQIEAQVDEFGTMISPEHTVREDMQLIRDDPILDKRAVVLGFVHDIETGLLREVV